MSIKNIELINFRNYKNSSFKFDQGVSIIIGPNGIGKTNILEGISLLSIGKSNRSGLEMELVNLDSDYSRVIGGYLNGDNLEVAIERKSNSNRVRKIYKVNGVVKSVTQFVGISKIIHFGPEQIRLVAGSPSRRREHLDKMLSQVYPEYHKNLLKYNRILKQRNKLLDQLKGQIIRNINEAQLGVWDEQLIQTGQVVQSLRKEFFKYSDIHMQKISGDLYQGEYELILKFDESTLTTELLKNIRRKELTVGTTQLGPHRDDYSFFLVQKGFEKNLKGYGSRGQQRTGVLCVKILELMFLEEKSGTKPILLLDDIFSELDENYRLAIENIVHNQQTIITTTDLESVPQNVRDRSKVIDLSIM